MLNPTVMILRFALVFKDAQNAKHRNMSFSGQTFLMAAKPSQTRPFWTETGESETEGRAESKYDTPEAHFQNSIFKIKKHIFSIFFSFVQICTDLDPNLYNLGSNCV